MQSFKHFHHTRYGAFSSLVKFIESNLSIKLTRNAFNSFETHFEVNMDFQGVKGIFVSFIDKFDSIALTKLENAPYLV